MNANPTGRIIDISTPFANTLAGWPGDTPYRFDLAWTRAEGSSVNVGRIESSLHTGTHADAPYHFDDSGATIDQLPLEPFVGPAWVVDCRGRPTIGADILEGLDLTQTPRILFRTDAWRDRTRFPDSIPTLDPDVPALLGRHGVILTGFDLPSVDDLESKTLPIHHGLAASGIMILEGIDLLEVVPGGYELIALPLRLAGADGAPVRAILREWKSASG